ncbi:MAG: cation-translocating P-type ATPase, partial [Myxococcales bacterium]
LTVAVASVLAFGIGIATGEPPSRMFMVAVALAVAAIPEGLPVVLTVVLALGVRRMAKRKAIVRKLPAIETVGSVTVIGSDKTGTLTQNRMTVQALHAGDALYALGGEAQRLLPEALPLGAPAPGGPAHRALLAGVLANESELFRTDAGVEHRGDPTETALLVAAGQSGLDHAALRRAFAPAAEIPFEPERQYSASVRTRDGAQEIFVKGAPERVLEMCRERAVAGGTAPLERERALEAAKSLAARGLRVLAMAAGRADAPVGEAVAPAGLTFLGLVGMMDPPRPGVREAIEGCREAGIRVVMITGDHAATASAVARELGIGGASPEVLTGVQLEAMDDEALRRHVQRVSVFARVTPEHKLRVVRALQHHREVVAVTGDGVNDAPALKAAEIGIAMGRSGTDVAREAADMVLADDNFVSIHAAVEEGRTTFDNLRKVTFFLVSTKTPFSLFVFSLTFILFFL